MYTKNVTCSFCASDCHQDPACCVSINLQVTAMSDEAEPVILSTRKAKEATQVWCKAQQDILQHIVIALEACQ